MVDSLISTIGAVLNGRLDNNAMKMARFKSDALMPFAAELRDQGHADRITYSRKVFIPLTHLCRDVCHYCTFARPPRTGERCFMNLESVLDVARAGEAAGCKEALFTLGDKPELRYRAARQELDQMGFQSTLDYLSAAAQAVLTQTGLLPHLNPGLLTSEDFLALRPVSASMGIMLETTASRLSARGGPHFGSPDKDPIVRLRALADAGASRVPLTTGLLIGIGENRAERIEALLHIRSLAEKYGHIQEVIIQNFVAKPNTRMADSSSASTEDLLWTIAVARLILGADANLQAPPNLSPGSLEALIAAGINDWGGVSPVTPDHVNPEHPWPQIKALEEQTEAAGKKLVERLTVYPHYIAHHEKWIDRCVRASVLAQADAEGLARTEDWRPGRKNIKLPDALNSPGGRTSTSIRHVLDRASNGSILTKDEIELLFSARGNDFVEVCITADALRRAIVGDQVTYVVNRNINYTNICKYRCAFCAFSKGRTADHLRGKPYLIDLSEIERRVREAWARGATEVCLQGGIHPDFTGDTYLAILRAAKRAEPRIHVHAFSPLEVQHGSRTLGVSMASFLERLIESGIGSLPGTAAEILDDQIRRQICPDKLSSSEWLQIIKTAHELGVPTTATIMFGHVEAPVHWVRHLMLIRDLQRSTCGFTEFVPLPFVAYEAPMFLKGRSRPGPTWRESLLMHAVARLVFGRNLPNIQTSWVKMGPRGARKALEAGANDLGGTLMNESITRAAGADHGEEFGPSSMERLILAADRQARQRTTLYGRASRERVQTAAAAAPLVPLARPMVANMQMLASDRVRATSS